MTTGRSYLNSGSLLRAVTRGAKLLRRVHTNHRRCFELLLQCQYFGGYCLDLRYSCSKVVERPNRFPHATPVLRFFRHLPSRIKTANLLLSNQFRFETPHTVDKAISFHSYFIDPFDRVDNCALDYRVMHEADSCKPTDMVQLFGYRKLVNKKTANRRKFLVNQVL